PTPATTPPATRCWRWPRRAARPSAAWCAPSSRTSEHEPPPLAHRHPARRVPPAPGRLRPPRGEGVPGAPVGGGRGVLARDATAAAAAGGGGGGGGAAEGGRGRPAARRDGRRAHRLRPEGERQARGAAGAGGGRAPAPRAPAGRRGGDAPRARRPEPPRA